MAVPAIAAAAAVAAAAVAAAAVWGTAIRAGRRFLARRKSEAKASKDKKAERGDSKADGRRRLEEIDSERKALREKLGEEVIGGAKATARAIARTSAVRNTLDEGSKRQAPKEKADADYCLSEEDHELGRKLIIEDYFKGRDPAPENEKPTAVIVIGQPGSGKSTLGDQAVARLKAECCIPRSFVTDFSVYF